MHRRAGKSVYFVSALMAAASKTKGKYHYVGPSIKQTKAISWDYAQQIAKRIGGCKINQSELKITLGNKSTVELLGVENIDSLRGRYSHGIALDEAQLMPQSHWSYVIRPLLADKRGFALIGGTPAGKHNLLGWAYYEAGNLDDWQRWLFTIEDTDLLQEDRDAMRSEMSDEAWNQEMLCSFTAAVQGAYYAKQIDALAAAKRLRPLPYDSELPVVAALDLGHDDLMPVIWAQEYGRELRIFHVETYRKTSIPDMIHHWRQEVKHPIDRLILPHDARVKDLTSGQTRQEVFEAFGYDVSIAPKIAKMEAIEQCRRMLPRTWICEDNAIILFEALAGYHAKYDENLGVTSLTPNHTWHSHYADAFQYLVTGDRAALGGWGAQPKLEFASNA